jgi:hypothetical protein
MTDARMKVVEIAKPKPKPKPKSKLRTIAAEQPVVEAARRP